MCVLDLHLHTTKLHKNSVTTNQMRFFSESLVKKKKKKVSFYLVCQVTAVQYLLSAGWLSTPVQC